MLYQNKSAIEQNLGDLVDSKGETSVQNVRCALETGLGMQANDVDRVIYEILGHRGEEKIAFRPALDQFRPVTKCAPERAKLYGSKRVARLESLSLPAKKPSRHDGTVERRGENGRVLGRVGGVAQQQKRKVRTGVGTSTTELLTQAEPDSSLFINETARFKRDPMYDLPSKMELRRKTEAEHKRILRKKKYERLMEESVERSSAKEALRKEAHLRIIKEQRTKYLQRAQLENKANLDIAYKSKGKRVLVSGNTHQIKIFG